MPRGIYKRRKKKVKDYVDHPEKIAIENVSGEHIDIEDWYKGDKKIAIQLANWLTKYTNNNVAISTTHDGALLIDYALQGRLQPTVKIYAGKIIWPKGTDFDLMMKFLSNST
jgi:hypothetical protein